MASPDVWKEFESNEVSHSVAHHLFAIDDLVHRNGYSRVTDVARALKISRGSASLTLKALKNRDLVVEDENKFLKLSDSGQRIIDGIRAKREIVQQFLRDVLGMEPRQAEIDACKVEHLFSLEAAERLLHFLTFAVSDSPVARTFLNAYRNDTDICHDLTRCPVCEDSCLLHIDDAGLSLN
jgi:Mn-dependent DtxR family transcriptional regulator